MNIVKVDIKTGEVLENNLREFWARQSITQNPEELDSNNTNNNSSNNNSSRHFHPVENKRKEKVDPALMKRIKRFTRRVDRRANSWKEEELYQLAVLMGRKKMSYKQAGLHLTRSPEACRYMYRKMKSAGVI